MFGLLFGTLSTMAQTGFIIGMGLLIDTFVVRTITVPGLGLARRSGELVAIKGRRHYALNRMRRSRRSLLARVVSTSEKCWATST